MRPLSLSIEGFTAFRDRQEIDFEPFELFVITGPTGAGKTSILDAIAFALYGEVPRIGGTKGTSDVISLGTDRATVQLVFSIADRGRYRIVRRISRRANVAQSVVLERQEGEDWLPVCTGGVTETNRQIEAIVGLDFDGFTRAVILPQGEFHRFLKGEAKERRKVLFSLLGVSYFQRMGALARARQADLEAGVKKTEDLLATHYDQVTESRLAELRAAAETETAAQEAITEALAIATENLERASTTTARIAALGSAGTGLGQIAAELAESLESIRVAETAHADASTALQRDAGALEAAEAAMSTATAKLEETIAEVGTLEAIAALAAAADTLAQAAEQERAATATLDGATIAEADATAELDRLAVVRDRAAAALADAGNAERAGIDAASEAARIAEELARARATAETREAELRSAETKLTDAEAQIGDRQPVALARRAELAAAVERWEAHRRMHTVAELAGGLGPGDPCPVCGVALAAAVAVDADVGTSLDTARSAAESARSKAEEGDRALSTAEAVAAAARDRREECWEVATSALGKHKSLSALLEATGTANAASVTAQSAADTLGEARAGREAEHELARQAAVAAEIALTERIGEVRNAQDRLAEVGERRDGATATLAGRFGAQIPGDTTARLAADRAKVIAATDVLSKSRATRDDLARQRAAAADGVATADRRLGDVDLELTRARTQAAGLASQVAAAPAATDVGRPPAATDDRVQSAQTLAEWCSDAVELLTSAARDATEDLDGANAAVLDKARAHGIEATEATEALTQLNQLQQEAVKSATAAEAAVGECERNLATRKQMEEGIVTDRARIAVLASLGRELQNDRFGDYIIDETLGLLCDRASGELKRISGGRYSLRPAKGEFQVIDHANADERRSVKTLSGGETFLASLALALALSRHVGELATEGLGAKLESVFIDEGFGTLDPATLDEVIDALERLRAEDLVVGVISHVPELAQRIQSGLEVHHDNGRSRITMVEPA